MGGQPVTVACNLNIGYVIRRSEIGDDMLSVAIASDTSRRFERGSRSEDGSAGNREVPSQVLSFKFEFGY